MKLLSWNVNGIRSAAKKGLLSLIESDAYDSMMFKGSKSNIILSEMHVNGYKPLIFASKAHKGYSETITLGKEEPKSVIYRLGDDRFDAEGRVLTIELADFYAVNAYFSNSRRDLSRLRFKLDFDDKIIESMQKVIWKLKTPSKDMPLDYKRR